MFSYELFLEFQKRPVIGGLILAGFVLLVLAAWWMDNKLGR